MGTPFTATSEELLHTASSSDSLTSVSTIPARAGMIPVIDWINGWCINPSSGAGYGTTIEMKVTTDQGLDICYAYDDGFAGVANELRSVFTPYWGGVIAVSTGTPGVPRIGQALTVTVTITGATNNAGALNSIGACVGYHYELG